MSDVRSQLPAIARSAMVAPLRALLQAAVLAGVLLTLVGCDAVQESFSLDRGTASEVVSTSTLPVFDPANPVSAFPANTLDPSGDVARYSLGSVYILGGQTVTPQEDLNYVREGIATIGSEMFTGTTASQERYNPGLLTAAHRTLPFSTIVKVTNLDNDRATLMRINDRAPNDFTHLIEVTPAAARVLGIGANSVSMVSVEVVETVTRNVAQATGGQLGRALPTASGPVIANPAAMTAQPAVSATIAPAAPVDTAPLDDPFAAAAAQNALTAPAVPVFNAAPADGTGVPTFYIQAGAFGERSNALSMQQQLASTGTVVILPAIVNGRQLWRVRVGPYASDADARVALGWVISAGAADAQVVID